MKRESVGQISGVKRLGFLLLRFFLITGILFSVFRLISSTLEGNWSIIALSILVIFLLVLFIIQRNPAIYPKALFVIYFSSYFGTVASFIYRGGIEGTSPYIFFIGMVISIILFQGKARILVFFLLVITCLFLFYMSPLVGLNFEPMIKPLDQRLVLISTILMLCATVIYLKNSLKRHSLLIIKRNEELEENQEKLKDREKEIRLLHEETVALNRELENIVHSRTEEIQLKNEQLAEYAYVNAHLMRAPLARIMGLAYLLTSRIPDSNEKLNEIQESAKKTDGVIRKINDKLVS